MTKRSIWYFTLMLSTFLLINTFLPNTLPKEQKQKESITNITISDLPITALKNTLGYAICSTVSLGDAFVTLSLDNYPKTLLRDNDTVHLVKKNANGILIYSDKISPLIESYAPLKEGDEFLIISDLSTQTPKTFPAVYTNNAVSFLSDTPTSNALAVIETVDGLCLAGLWNSELSVLTNVDELIDLKDLISEKGISYINDSEKYYLLENEHMQVVFSDRGGAVAEMNLKLHSKASPASIIYPVAIDKKMRKQSPQNDRFPLHMTYVADPQGNATHKESQIGGYTPLLRRDIIGENGKVLFKVPAQHYALALRQSKRDLIPTYSVTKFTKNSIQFKGKIEGKEVTRTYQLVDNAPFTLEMKNSVNGHVPDLMISSGITEVEIDSGSFAPSLLYYNFTGKKMKLDVFKLPKQTLTVDNISPNWTANGNGFFTTILNPKGENPKGVTTAFIEGNNCPSRATLVDVNLNLNPKEKFPGYEILTPYESAVLPSLYYFYAGPLDKNTLSAVDSALTNDITGSNPEFVKAITVRGWLTFISDPFAKFMNIILDFFYMITHSWGISIILLTITLRLLLYPFNAKAFKSMMKMKKLAPKQKEIEAKYKNDPQRLRMELSMLFRNEGVNPLASILPMFLQIPFFIGMFDLLKTKFALRGAIFIPGWIDNLTAPDSLFSWGINIPFLGNEFHLLPILGAIAMHFSQKLTTSMQGPKKNPTDMEKQMQSMGPILTLVFLFAFYNLASGLNIYLILSSLLGVLQQWYVNKKFGEKRAGISVLKG